MCFFYLQQVLNDLKEPVWMPVVRRKFLFYHQSVCSILDKCIVEIMGYNMGHIQILMWCKQVFLLETEYHYLTVCQVFVSR